MSFGFLSVGELYSLSCALIWAVGVILFRKSGETVSPVALNLFKNTVGLALFFVTLALLRIPLVPSDATASDWFVLILSGVVGIGVADTLFFASLNRLGAGNSAIVDGLYSPFVILCAWAYLHETIGVAVLGAMALMVTAILLVTWSPKAQTKPTDRGRLLSGVAGGVLGVLLMAIGVAIIKPVLEHADPWWVTTIRLVAGTVFLAFQGAFRRHRQDVMRTFRPGSSWLLTVPAGVIGCYLAMITWILGMKYTFASKASVLNQMSTIFVVLLAAVFLGEKLTARRGLAVGIAFAGALVVTW